MRELRTTAMIRVVATTDMIDRDPTANQLLCAQRSFLLHSNRKVPSSSKRRTRLRYKKLTWGMSKATLATITNGWWVSTGRTLKIPSMETKIRAKETWRNDQPVEVSSLEAVKGSGSLEYK
jgi:hypothetical protein